MAPKISIIVPVYNSAVYLRQCLDSLVNQTLRDIEIICVCDISTDNSLEILNEYAAKDKRIHVLVPPKNRKLGAARNMGIHIAKGEYIGFVDSDDWIENDMYEKLLTAALAADGAEISSATQIYNNLENEQWTETHIPLEASLSSRDELNKHIVQDVSAALWMTIIKKRLFFDNKLFFAEELVHEDVPITHALYCSANFIALVDAPFYHYRKNYKSLSYKPSDTRFDLLVTSVMYMENMKRLGFYERYKEECDYWFYTRYYCRMLATCFFTFPVIRKEYIKKIKDEFPKYVDNIYANKYYRSRKIKRFDVFLWILNKNTEAACFLYNAFKFLRLNLLLEWYRGLKGMHR